MSEKVVTIGAEQSVVSIESDKRRFTVKREGRTDVIELLSLSGEEAVVAVNGRAARIPFPIQPGIDLITLDRKEEQKQ
jgi:hypothetical protein